MNVRIRVSEKVKILNSGDLYGVMQRVLMRERKIDRNKEHFWVIGLANNNPRCRKSSRPNDKLSSPLSRKGSACEGRARGQAGHL